MLAQGIVGFKAHFAVDAVHAAGNGLYQSAPAYNGVEAQRYVVLRQPVGHELAAEVVLVNYLGVGSQLVGGVAYSAHAEGALVFIDGHLGGGGAGVDYKYMVWRHGVERRCVGERQLSMC